MARYHDDAVAVIGLGRFGRALALELGAGGTEVLAIDIDSTLIQKLSGLLTHAVIADSTDEEALRQLSVDEFDRVVVGMGNNLEASILTCSVLQSIGIRDIWAKAISEPHARILTQIGVHHVVLPEHDTGRRVAHLVAGRLLDYMEFDDGFAIAKMRPPKQILEQKLSALGLREEHSVTIVGLKRTGEDFTYAVSDMIVHQGDLIIVSGTREKVENFAELHSD